MKNITWLLFVFVLFISIFINAQKVEYNGKEYHVKGDKIFLNKEDVTSTLTIQQQTDIKNRYQNKLTRERRIAETKKAEKKQKKIEKKLKKAEKELKRREKAERTLSNSQHKYDKGLKKYEKLKTKGKLSSEDDKKWQEKLSKMLKHIEKNKRKLRRL